MRLEVAMPDETTTLEERIAMGEDSMLELKSIAFSGGRVVSPDTRDIADEFAAAANASGATFVFGVDDKTHTILGIERMRLDLSETWVRNICNDSVKPPLNSTIRKVVLKGDSGKRCYALCVDVPRSLFVHRSPHGYFYRIGSSKREMSPEYLARLFQQRSQTRMVCFDEQVVAAATLEDLEYALFDRFRTSLSSADDKEFLRKLHLIAKDDDGVWRPTVSGILFASKSPEAFLPSAYIQAVCYRGVERNAEEQLDARDIVGPLDKQVIEACHFVRRNMRIFALKRPARIDIPQYPMNAVFEAIVNAVAHRDYAISGAKIRLHMFSDRIELFSPGGLPNSLALDEISERQFARNELICTCLSKCPLSEVLEDVTRAQLMDRRGEGVPVILESTKRFTSRAATYKLFGDSELLLTIPSIDSSDKAALEHAVSEKSAIGREKSAIEARVARLRLSAPTREKVLLLLKSFGGTRPFGRTDVVAVAHVKYSNAGSLLSLLREHALIVPVLGEGKGKYRFNG